MPDSLTYAKYSSKIKRSFFLSFFFFFFFFFFTSRGNSIWNSGHFKLNMIMDYVTFIREHRIHIHIKNSHISSEKPPYHWHLEYKTKFQVQAQRKINLGRVACTSSVSNDHSLLLLVMIILLKEAKSVLNYFMLPITFQCNPGRTIFFWKRSHSLSTFCKNITRGHFTLILKLAELKYLKSHFLRKSRIARHSSKNRSFYHFAKTSLLVT